MALMLRGVIETTLSSENSLRATKIAVQPTLWEGLCGFRTLLEADFGYAVP